MFNEKEKQFILNLARRSIEYYFENGALLEIGDNEVENEEMKEDRSCFVTLTIRGELRGCIGHILPIQPLYLDIIENAAAAAFEDPRFPPLTKEEFAQVEIEVSLLTSPSDLQFTSPEDLLNKLRPNIDGVILKQGQYSATYLPQVWEQLPAKEDFLSSLCMKAGLPAMAWRKNNAKIQTYQADVIK